LIAGEFTGTYTAMFTRTGNVFVFLYALNSFEICMIRQMLLKTGPAITFPSDGCVKLNFNGTQTKFFNFCVVEITGVNYPAAAIAVASDTQVFHMDVLDPKHNQANIQIADQFDNPCNNELPPFHTVTGTMAFYQDPSLGKYVVALEKDFEVCEGMDCSQTLSTHVLFQLDLI
jgi:hypothetical protein